MYLLNKRVKFWHSFICVLLQLFLGLVDVLLYPLPVHLNVSRVIGNLQAVDVNAMGNTEEVKYRGLALVKYVFVVEFVAEYLQQKKTSSYCRSSDLSHLLAEISCTPNTTRGQRFFSSV